MKTTPVILQDEIAECGLACVAMIAAYYGRHVDLAALRRVADPANRGSSLRDLINLGDNLGFAVKSLRVGLRQLPKLQLPLIIHWNLVHFVVLVAIKGDTYVIHDPASGRREVPAEEFSRSFSGLAQEFSPRPDFVAADERRRVPLTWAVAGGPTYLPILGTALVLSLVMQLLIALLPISTQMLIDHVVARRDTLALMIGVGCAYAGVVLFCLLLWFRSRLLMYMNSSIDTYATQRLAVKILSMPYEFFARRDVGSLLSRFSNLAEVRRVLARGFAESAVDAFVALLLLLALSIYTSRVALVMCATMFVYVAFRWLLVRTERLRLGEMFQADGGQAASLIETLSRIETVKANALEADRARFWLARFMNYQNAVVKHAQADYVRLIITTSVLAVGYGSAAVLTILAVFDDALTLGEAFTVLVLSGVFLARVSGFMRQFFELLVAHVHLDRLSDVVHGESEQAGTAKPGSVRGRIEFRDVGFRYAPGAPYVIRNVSFSVQSGECVVITGPSGCGKSTILSLLLGLRAPTEGEVLIDDVPVSHWDRSHLRRAIGTVLQSDQLFIGSVQENLSLFDIAPPEDRMSSVIAACHLRNVIDNLPMGEHTVIGEATGFSGGEKQRLLLARALYKNPSLLLLDEATSHLDEQTETEVCDALSAMGITRIMVAHRRRTIEIADRVIRLTRATGQSWSTVQEGEPRHPSDPPLDRQIAAMT